MAKKTKRKQRRKSSVEVDLIAAGYEWECPKCGFHNKEIEAKTHVKCPNRNCRWEFEASPPEHAYE